jgi:hypothetical protein
MCYQIMEMYQLYKGGIIDNHDNSGHLERKWVMITIEPLKLFHPLIIPNPERHIKNHNCYASSLLGIHKGDGKGKKRCHNDQHS